MLVVEDSFLVAQELIDALERERAEVVGPVSTLADAWRLAREHYKLDAAVLDVNLRGEMIWPLADFLNERNIKLVFATGYAAKPIKERYGSSQIVEKPVPARTVVRLLLGD